MNKNLTYIITGAACLVAVISLANALSASSKNKQAEAEIAALQDQIIQLEASIPTTTPEPEIVYLDSTGDTNEVTALKTMLAEKEAVLESIQSNTNRPPRQRESFEDRMAKMKEEEPEEYAEMIKRREERQQEMRYNLAERTATFMDLDTSMMTEEERANHEMLVEKMASVWELTEQFQDPEAAPDREAMRELSNAAQEVRPLLQQERTVMFKQLGSDLGYEGESAQDFATHVEDIIEATSLQMPRGGRGGGGGGGRGGGGR